MESRWGDFKHAVSSCFLFSPPTLATSFISVYSRDAHRHTPQCTASKAQDDTHEHTPQCTPSKTQDDTHGHTPQCTPTKAQGNTHRHTPQYTALKSPGQHTQTHTPVHTLKSPEQDSWTRSCRCADTGYESMIPKLISKWLVGGWFSLGCAPKLEAYLEISSWKDLLGLLRIFQFHFEDYFKEP